MKRLALTLLCVTALLIGARAASTDGPPDPGVSFSGSNGVIELERSLSLFHPSARTVSDRTVWYAFTAVNDTKQAVTRVLQAGQPPGIGLNILPQATRPAILQVVSTHSGVVIEGSNAYGRHSFRVTVPASTSVPLAVRVRGGEMPPSLLAWTEPALAAHNRQLAIFIAAVAGLIGAAAAIAGGLAVMTHHGPPRWAAVTLLLMLLTRLASSGMFDGSLVSGVGGPYGLAAFLMGLSFAAGVRFVDLVVPFKDFWPPAQRYLGRILIAEMLVSALAYLGVPGMTLLINVVVGCGILAVVYYLVRRGRMGSRTARVLMPSAGLFALVVIIGAFTALGGFGGAPLAPDLAGAFAAAAAVLLALAVTAGEGIAVIPFARAAHAPHPQPKPAPASAPPPPPAPAPSQVPPHAAIEAIGASFQGIFELDFASDTVILSREAAMLIGLEGGRMPQAAWLARIYPDDRNTYRQAVTEFSARSGLAFRVEFRVRAEDGRYPWFELRATTKGPENGRAERCVGLVADVSSRKESEAEMVDRTLRDPLTGLGNRIALMEELEGMGARLREATFALLDIDRFKTIHASLGDDGGDSILAKLAERLAEHYSGLARVFRVGGDAFALVIQKPAQKPADFGAELVAVCGAAHLLDGRNIFAPASIGVALGRDARDPIDLLKNAELALMHAKRQGGDCAKVYSRTLEPIATGDAVVLETELRHALEKGEIEVFYQPIVRLSDRTVAGFEALLRWRHPKKGLVAPADFIGHSEETGLIVALGRLALDRAARDLAQWQRFFPLPEPLFASVNLSRRQMRDAGFEEHLARLLTTVGVAPGSLKLEVTESAAATDTGVRALMERLRAMGAGLAIDDFGTGMSSLSQLADLPFDTVKIDKSFLSRHGGTDVESEGDVVLASIVSLAHDLRRNVIVEGVENESDADRMAELGCEYAQGFLFSEPLAMQDALAYIARRFRAAGMFRGSGAAGFG